MMLLTVTLIGCLFLIACTSSVTPSSVTTSSVDKSWTSDWDHFVFTQTWPPGTCALAPRAHHVCHVAQQVDSWTIHGLWPSKGSTKGPTSCNNSLPFDFSKIANLQSDLNQYWPNLYNDTSQDGFWAHEWTKHGTCCQDLPATQGEHNYFAKALELNRKYNILNMLNAGGVVPSVDAQYSYKQFLTAIQKTTGFVPVLQCADTKLHNGTNYHLIAAIEICLTKDFIPMTCGMSDRLDEVKYGPQSNCPRSYNFNYPPIQHV